MIQGVVNDAYEAVVRLTVQGPSGQSREIEAVIDTGYNGFLTLPPALVTELSLVYRGRGRAILADGNEAFFDIYDVAVLWGHPSAKYQGQRRRHHTARRYAAAGQP